MNFNSRGLLSKPLTLAILFFAIPPALAILFPLSLWSGNDYELLGLANALNMAYRLADLTLYGAMGMSFHPGVPFYVTSWLALAITGHPLGLPGLTLFNSVVDNVEIYHFATICLAALAGAAGVFVFVRTAQKLVPPSVALTAIAIWLACSPATILTFASPGNETFAFLINSLFFAALMKLSFEQPMRLQSFALAGCIGALAYLNKLAYIYIPLALAAAMDVKLIASRAGWARSAVLLTVSTLAFLLTIWAVAYFFIGWDSFRQVLTFHRQVFFGSGLYGTGDRTVVSGSAIFNTIAAIPADRNYAMFLALIGGIVIGLFAIITAIRKPQHLSIAILSMGAAAAAVLSSLTVFKHYRDYYTAAVSATLPLCFVCGYLLVRAAGHRLEARYHLAGILAALLMAFPVAESTFRKLSQISQTSRLVKADTAEIAALTAQSKLATYYTYKSPFAAFGKGFVIAHAGIPRLTEAFLQNEQNVLNTMTSGTTAREVGIYVIDKNYFGSADAIRSAPNLDLLGSKPVVYREGDKLVELRTVFLLVRG